MSCALQMLEGSLSSGCVMSRGLSCAICSTWPAQLEVSRGLLQQTVEGSVMAVACLNHSPEGAQFLLSIRACGAQPSPVQVLISATGRRRLLDLERMSSSASARWLAQRPRPSCSRRRRSIGGLHSPALWQADLCGSEYWPARTASRCRTCAGARIGRTALLGPGEHRVLAPGGGELPSFFQKLYQVTSKHARPFRRDSRRTPERPRKTLRAGMAEQLQQDETFLTGLRHSQTAIGEGIQKT
jgi:hypothetical protein